MNKEQNFISAVVYVRQADESTMTFFQNLANVLECHFLQYEIIAVNQNIKHKSVAALCDWGKTLSKPFTIIHMAAAQSHEQCMNAGLDCSIGDYIYEFDIPELLYPAEMIWQVYETAMKGNDIVSLCPRTELMFSKLFYAVFNYYSRVIYPLHTNALRLVSRRALNRVHAISETLPYRKAAYAFSGLKVENIFFEGRVKTVSGNRLKLAVDSLVLYSDFGYRFSLSLAMLMGSVTVLGLLYTVFIWLFDAPVAGWTTIMLILSFGLSGLFFVSAIALKYLTLNLSMVFRKQDYLVENVNKL